MPKAPATGLFLIGLLVILVVIVNLNHFPKAIAMENKYNDKYNSYNYNDKQFSDYPSTKINKYECQKGQFEGFFVSSPEFCDLEIIPHDTIPNPPNPNPPNPNSTICQGCVSVFATPAVSILGFTAWHTFIVYSDFNGIEYFYRAGPGLPCSNGGILFQCIKPDWGLYKSGTIDWAPGAPKILLRTGVQPSIQTCFENVINNIILANPTPYNALGPNSNTFTTYLLATCGIPPSPPPVSPIPGWNQNYAIEG